MTLIPDIQGAEAFSKAKDDTRLWRAVIEKLGGDYGFSGEIRQFYNGSTVVASIGDEAVIKLFEPWTLALHSNEASALGFLHSMVPIPTPKLFGSGKIEDWGYLVMERLPGENLTSQWDKIEADNLAAICAEVGHYTRVLHSLPIPPDPRLQETWREFAQERKELCIERHRCSGIVNDSLLAEISDYVEDAALEDEELVFLHTELDSNNVLVNFDNGRWQLSGLVDFEPSTVGYREYDYAGPSIFLARGDGARFSAWAEGCKADLDSRTRKRILQWILLHRYSNLRYYFEVVGRKSIPSTLVEIGDILVPQF
jgi:hygromycin-B 7''-O-kinase